MLKISTVIILLTLLACGRPDKGTHARSFLSRIDSVHADIDQFGNRYDEYSQKIAKEFAENNKQPIGGKQLDSFSRLLKDYEKAIDRGIYKLKTIPEFDEEYKVVQANINFLNHESTIWNDLGNMYIKIYKSGWENLSEGEQQALPEFVRSMQEKQTITHQLKDSVNIISSEFGRRYGFRFIPSGSKN